jgi:hypothetical protein
MLPLQESKQPSRQPQACTQMLKSRHEDPAVLPLISSPLWKPSPKQRSSWFGHFWAQQRTQAFGDSVSLHRGAALFALGELPLPQPPRLASKTRAAKEIFIGG